MSSQIVMMLETRMKFARLVRLSREGYSMNRRRRSFDGAEVPNLTYIYYRILGRHIYTYIHLNTCIYIQTFIYTHTYTIGAPLIKVYIHTVYIHTYITYTHVCIHTFLHTYMHTYTYIYIIHTYNTCIQYVHTYIYTYMYTYIHAGEGW